uniref:DM2 domain-containing protein n=1 Tax=Ananas comosus var. bracteatus TaxID=296719 RepID=A0A6V7QCK3_ANACO|nr:unnamed protein product [Ananas comosus var. bracteatus]
MDLQNHTIIAGSHGGGEGLRRLVLSGGGGGGGGGGEAEELGLHEAHAAVAGDAQVRRRPEISRPEAVKKVWEHIKAHNLQDPANKKLIHCDEKLKAIFGGKETVGMLEIAKLISSHFLKSK